jgi:curli production assembly/transport component CsgG
MAIRQLYLFLSVALLSNCALIIDPLENNLPPLQKIEKPEIGSLLVPDLANIKSSNKSKPVVAIYTGSFTDQTGQRRSNSSYATFSSAVTQAPDAYLIRALKHAGSNYDGFFEVVERVGLDNVTKERQIIRSTRQEFKEDIKLQPLMFAGLIMQGGVISYESNIKSGGAGARYLGVGMSRQYKQDTVTISLRTVSVSTGKVLLEVLVTKTILSASIDQDVFRFITDSTELVEIENGLVRNESINIALQTAIETAVLQTIKEGATRGYWNIDEKIKTINCDANCIASIRG